MVVCTKPTVSPTLGGQGGSGLTEGCMALSAETGYFYPQQSWDTSGQACSTLPGSSVTHGTSFISVKANLAVESFATSLINTPSS